ncbi:MAG: ArsR/SmtB family transcription factor [Flavobacteriales bacterium]
MENKKEFQSSIFSEISRITKAISNNNRMEIIHFIANGEKSVEEIAKQTGLSFANASQHLQNLKKERLVKIHKKGVQVYYSLATPEVYLAWKGLRDLALSISLPLKDTFSAMTKECKMITSNTFDEFSNRQDIFWIDVRPKDEFGYKHFPKAQSFPLVELESRLSELPKDKLIVAYCRGKFCTMADEAVIILKKHGFNAVRIEENILEIC